MEFRDLFHSVTDLDPFTTLTIGPYLLDGYHEERHTTYEFHRFFVEMWECNINKELNHDEDMKHQIVDPLEPCDALYSGRTNAAKLYHECKDDEEIR
jgi:hypothetical protein